MSWKLLSRFPEELFHVRKATNSVTHCCDNGEAHYRAEVVVGKKPAARGYTPHDARKESYKGKNNIIYNMTSGVDQCIQKFLDVARQTECFFLQKRLQLSVQKPEQVEKEDASELKNELQRKEMLIQKHLTKIHHWQQVLEDINVQHKKPTELPQGPLAFLEQASANIPAPMKPN
ncbi:mediator of RNA polymerase II transcription subunit 28 [Labeo rohita]|uniref:Mediator of RNA polymerase II transcription subunit 28 n=1 Tax=Labeo rohita TaxID=84645 RepID=A0A498LBV1_LABRO|nr:mediator of RNA polymerase II transcription subunit 28 [Labeo rohita]